MPNVAFLRPHHIYISITTCFCYRFGFGRWNVTTVLILNLALMDLLYCSIQLPLYASQYFTRGWSFGVTPRLCFIDVAFRYWNAYLVFNTMALLALTRLAFMCSLSNQASATYAVGLVFVNFLQRNDVVLKKNCR